MREYSTRFSARMKRAQGHVLVVRVFGVAGDYLHGRRGGVPLCPEHLHGDWKPVRTVCPPLPIPPLPRPPQLVILARKECCEEGFVHQVTPYTVYGVCGLIILICETPLKLPTRIPASSNAAHACTHHRSPPPIHSPTGHNDLGL